MAELDCTDLLAGSSVTLFDLDQPAADRELSAVTPVDIGLNQGGKSVLGFEEERTD